MAKPYRILLVVENDHYPQDMRIYNECMALAGIADCHVLAPRAPHQYLRETVGNVRCYRYPSPQGHSLRGVLVEYLVSWIWLTLLIPFIVLLRRIDVVHVANPPDFIIPSMAWLRWYGVKLVYDIHDLTTETFKGKLSRENSAAACLLPALEKLETLSISAADLVICTNNSILERVKQKHVSANALVVRNSNTIVFRSLTEVAKPPSGTVINIGYFGLLANDRAAGMENMVAIACSMAAKNQQFKFSVIGAGPGLPKLKEMLLQTGMSNYFEFHGFIPMPTACELIKTFDFGLVAWGDLPKNHLHTAMKVMDYMCCAVPVCSLLLKEQLLSTDGIGLHAASFEELTQSMIDIHNDTSAYEELRQRTLQHFNDVLCWELQAKKLLTVYGSLLTTKNGSSIIAT